MEMKFKTTGLRTLLLLVASFITFASTAQDLSGNWKLNTSKSKLNAEFSMAPGEVIITHNGNNLTVEKHHDFQGQAFTSKDNFTLDGKECINEGFQGNKKKSTANWSDDKKVLTIKSSLDMGDGGLVTITETLTLESGILTMVSAASSNWGDFSETQVFEKK